MLAPATVNCPHPTASHYSTSHTVLSCGGHIQLTALQKLGWMISYSYQRPTTSRLALLLTCLLLFYPSITPRTTTITIPTLYDNDNDCHNSILSTTASASRIWDRGKDLSVLSSSKFGLINWNWTLVAEAVAVAEAESVGIRKLYLFKYLSLLRALAQGLPLLQKVVKRRGSKP